MLHEIELTKLIRREIIVCLLLNYYIGVILQSYTQYIPLSVYDLQTWMGSPSIYVYDCSNAGIILNSFKQFSNQCEQELEVNGC